MQLNEFLKNYPNVLFGSDGDAVFSALRVMLNGMSSYRLAKLLNYACRFIGDDEYYLEVGIYTGFSLIASSYSCGKKFIGIDNFSEIYQITGDVKTKLSENMGKFIGSYTVIDSDFRKVDLSELVTNGDKMGILFVDAKHTYEDVKETIEWATPHFSNEALIVFDDVKVPGVRKAIDEIKKDERFDEFFYANSFHDPNPDCGMSSNAYIHNGISLMTYRKEPVIVNQ